jgi:HK97 family phage major capsid protein
MEIPQQWMNGAVYLMSSRTLALLFTMSDTSTRPLFSALPERGPGFSFAGSPIFISSWMPDVQPGATPVLFVISSRRTPWLIEKR